MWCSRMWCSIIIVLSPNIVVNNIIMFGKTYYYQTPDPQTPHPWTPKAYKYKRNPAQARRQAPLTRTRTRHRRECLTLFLVTHYFWLMLFLIAWHYFWLLIFWRSFDCFGNALFLSARCYFGEFGKRVASSRCTFVSLSPPQTRTVQFCFTNTHFCHFASFHVVSCSSSLSIGVNFGNRQIMERKGGS